MPAISIIIPVYNVENYLPKCLDSLLGQTFKDIEIICVNDGSKDGSLAVLQKYAAQDSRIKVFDQANAGAAQARNFGLKQVQGRFVMFCDSDDWYEPQTCELMYQAMQDKTVDFAVCPYQMRDIGEDSRRQLSLLKDEYPFEAGRYILDNNVRQKMTSVVWDKIFRTEYLQKYGIVFPATTAEDLVFVHQYMAISKTCVVLDRPLYNYLIRGNSFIGGLLSGKQNQNSDFYQALLYECAFLKKYNALKENEHLVLWTLEHNFVIVWNNLSSSYQNMVCQQASHVLDFFPDADVKKYGKVLELLKAKKYKALQKYMDRKCGRRVSLGENIFSMKNSKDKQYKLIRVFGLKFQVKRKKSA